MLIFFRVILSSLKHNQNLDGLHLNLASNDLGPNIRSFMYDFNQNYVIKSVDLSDNSKIKFYSQIDTIS